MVYKDRKETTLFLIRHGETDWNVNQRYLGKTDVSLSETGKKQIHQLYQQWQHLLIDVVYTSPLKRARETTAILCPENKIPVVAHDGLRELDFGDWEGLTAEQIAIQFPHKLADWKIDSYTHMTPSGESMHAVQDRVTQTYQEATTAYQGKTIAFIGHGGSFSILLCFLLGITPKARWQFRLSPASISKLSVSDDDVVIVTLNDTSHLK